MTYTAQVYKNEDSAPKSNMPEGWGDFEVKLNDRFSEMKVARSHLEQDWNTTIKQVDATSMMDGNKGTLIVNVPLERNLIEMSMGRYAKKLNFNIEPVGKPNVEELMPAKYILEHFLDMGDFHYEKRERRMHKCTFGTGIWFCGITFESNIRYEIQEGVDQNCDIRTSKYKPTNRESYILTPRNIPIHNFYMDDRAIGRDFKYARDCFILEKVSKEEFENRYKGNKSFKQIDSIDEEMRTENGKIDTNTNGKENEGITLKHYYNKITQEYGIIANDTLIYMGRMLFKHGLLPVVMTQYYPNPMSAYGIGIPRKIRYLKGYKSDMLQFSLDRAKMSAGVNILVGNDSTPDEERYTGAGEINIRRTNGGIDQFKQFQIDGNTNGFQQMIQMIDDLIIQDTGENIKAPYSSPANTAFEVGVMEENKLTRISAMDEADDIGMQEALTMALSNITQFAPRLLKTKEKDGTEVFPTIIIPNYKVENKNGMKIIEDYGNYGTFEFKDDMVKGEYRVRITTPSTLNTLKSLDKNSITQYLNNMGVLFSMNPDLVKQMDFKSLKELIDFTYGYDSKFMATTKKSQIEEAVKMKTQELLSAISGQDETTNQQPMGSNPYMTPGADPTMQSNLSGANPVAANQSQGTATFDGQTGQQTTKDGGDGILG